MVYHIYMKTMQIALDDTLVSFLDGLAAHQQKTRTALIREAIKYWIQQKNIEQFETQWISALKKDQSKYPDEAATWLAAEAWNEP